MDVAMSRRGEDAFLGFVLVATIVLCGSIVISTIWASEQRQRDHYRVLIGVEEALGKPTAEEKQTALLQATQEAGYTCEPSPKGEWTCR
jgi:hypothetical protein